MPFWYNPTPAIHGSLWPRWGRFNPQLLCIASSILMHWFPQNKRRKFPFWTMPHHHFYVCVPPNNYKTKKSSRVTNKHLERTSKSTPTPSTLVPANIRTFSIPSDDWLDVQRPKSALLNCLFLLMNFWRPVDHVLVAVATPDLPPSILLLSNYNPRSEHHQIPSYGYQRRTSLEGGKIVPPKLISPTWYIIRRSRCCKGTQPPMMMKDGGTMSKSSCNVQNDLPFVDYYIAIYRPLNTLKCDWVTK